MYPIMDNCQVCKQALSKPARLLPCLHSACEECLQSQLNFEKTSGDKDGQKKLELEQRIISCPQCGIETSVPRGGVRCLPLDPQGQQSLQHCQLCSFTPTLAFCHCEECALFMCPLCAETHIKFGDVGGHSIVQLQETRVKETSTEQKLCNRHPTEEATSFCWDCRTSVCSKCCQGHRLEGIEDASHKLNSLMREATEGATAALNNVVAQSNSSAAITASIIDRCDAVAKEVDNFIQGYKEALIAHHETLRNEIEKIREDKTKLVKDNLDNLEIWINRINHIIQFAEYLSSYGSPKQVVSVGAWTLDRLSEVSSSSVFLKQTNISNWIRFLPDEKPTNSPKYFLTGIISTQAVSPLHSSLDNTGVLNCKQQIKATFILKTRDSENRLVNHGGEKVEAQVEYKDASQRQLPVNVVDEGDGTYSVSFKPDAFGNLLLSILIQNTHVKGSPYTVAVSSIRQHKGVFHCCTFCSSGGNKNTTCACGAKMPGYQGCGHGHVGHPGRRHWSCCANVLQISECGRPLTHQYSF